MIDLATRSADVEKLASAISFEGKAGAEAAALIRRMAARIEELQAKAADWQTMKDELDMARANYLHLKQDTDSEIAGLRKRIKELEKAPKMTRAEFIAQYNGLVGGVEKTHYGVKLGNRKKFAVPCQCRDPACLGWGMVSEEQLADHFELYYWPDGEATEAPDAGRQMPSS